jgi:hypothetical protein
MTYLQSVEKEFREVLNRESEDEIARYFIEKLLQSYKNGLKAGQSGETVKREGKSRYRGAYGKAGGNTGRDEVK